MGKPPKDGMEEPAVLELVAFNTFPAGGVDVLENPVSQSSVTAKKELPPSLAKTKMVHDEEAAAPVAKPHYTGHRKRLRERFLTAGPAALADYELLEMILFPAKPMGDVKPMAKALITALGSFGKVLHAEPTELMKVDGVNEAAVVAIKVAKAASERLLREEVVKRPLINDSASLIDYCRVHIGNSAVEEFHVLFLNNKLQLMADERQQKGTVNHTPVYPREVVKRALEIGASSVILVHNHPSGDVRPSKADIAVTEQIVAAAKTLGIGVIDHIIIGPKAHFSFQAEGVLSK